MRIVHSIARPARALLFGSLVAFVAAQSFGRPGDRLDRYPLLVTEPSAEVVGPSLDMDETGRFVATWASDEGQDTHVLFQRFAANGTPTGGKVRVGTASDPNDDTFVTTNVVVAVDGSFTVVWAACVFPCQASGIYARRYTANGEPTDSRSLGTAQTPCFRDRARYSFGYSIPTASRTRRLLPLSRVRRSRHCTSQTSR
jgi:hypothetical protein